MHMYVCRQQHMYSGHAYLGLGQVVVAEQYVVKGEAPLCKEYKNDASTAHMSRLYILQVVMASAC